MPFIYKYGLITQPFGDILCKSKMQGDFALKKIIVYSFKRSLPVLFGYLFLGTAFGILLRDAGYGLVWAFFSSLFIYAGSGQFLMCDFLKAGNVSLATACVMTILLNSRHIFYGLSFITRFKVLGKKKFIPIYELTDETYSVLCFTEHDNAHPLSMLFISLFDHSYWIIGSCIGSLISNLPFDFTGVDFSMTALFVVLFVEQWKNSSYKLPALTGLISSAFFLILLGPDNFIFPSLLLSCMILIFTKGLYSKKEITSKEAAK